MQHFLADPPPGPDTTVVTEDPPVGVRPPPIEEVGPRIDPNIERSAPVDRSRARAAKRKQCQKLVRPAKRRAWLRHS